MWPGFSLMKNQAKYITCWKEKIVAELCGGIRIIEKNFLYYSIINYYMGQNSSDPHMINPNYNGQRPIIDNCIDIAMTR
jgi:hypothetical protein